MADDSGFTHINGSNFSSQTLLSGLRHPLNDLPSIDWNSTSISADIAVALHQIIKNSSRDLKNYLEQCRKKFEEDGFCLVRLERFQETYGDEITKRLITALSCNFGNPFGVFHSRGFFQTLGVNPNAKELRAESTGYIPFHIDFCQASNPPKGVVLYCVRPDPMGGGKNLIVNYKDILSSMSAELLREIRETNISYSTLFNTYNIGEEFNPHPLIDERNEGFPIFRYNGKALPDLPSETQELYKELEKIFREESVAVMIEKGDVLFLNQHVVLHAREPLNLDNSGQKPSQDRLLWQLYISEIDPTPAPMS